MTVFDSSMSLADLRERYPDPPQSLVIGQPPLIHHGFSLGRTVVCIKACQEAMQEARQAGDQAAISHLQQHIQAFQQHTKEAQAFTLQQDAAARRRGKRALSPSTTATSPANAH